MLHAKNQGRPAAIGCVAAVAPTERPKASDVLIDLPEQRALPGIDTRPRPLYAWLHALPYVDAENAARQVNGRLRDINHQILPAGQRLQLLAAFRHSYERLHDALLTLARQEDPLRQSGALTLLSELTELMSFGYKYALRDSLNEGQRWGRTRQLTQAANYTQHFLTLLLICRYQAYQPAPESGWRELGNLVRYAETHQLGATRDSTFTGGRGELSVLAGYRALAMLRLADPYRLPGHLIWEAYGYVMARQDRIVLSNVAPEDLAVGVFGLSLDHEPQGSRPLPAGGVERNAWRCLDGRELLTHAQLDLDRIVAGTRPARVGLSSHLTRADAVQLLGRMLGQWTHSPQRKSPRFASSGPVDVASGLEAAYCFLNRGTPFDPADHVPSEDEDDIDFGLPTHRQVPVRRDFPLLSCPTRNRGNGGLALLGRTADGLGLRVGQLLLIRSPSGASGAVSDWLVGVVRWLISRGDECEAGVQYIARECSPAVVKPTAGAQRHCQPALRTRLTLPNGNGLDILVGPRGLYRDKAILELQQHGQARQIRCTHLLESGSGFERFSYEILG